MFLSLVARIVVAVADATITLCYPRLTWKFFRRLGYWPRLAAPRSFREKMQWRKIFDRNPLFVQLQDKLSCRAYVAQLVPDQAMPAVRWSGDEAAALPRDGLPDAFVLKTNHGSGFNLMVPDRCAFTHDALVSAGRRLLQRRIQDKRREWAYTAIAPRLYVEDMLRTATGAPPPEYKITVMNGRPVLIAAVDFDGRQRRYGYYSPAWVRIEVAIGAGSRAADAPPPPSLARMLQTATIIGRQVDMVRVDFYDVDGAAYFGECTVYSVSGLLPIRPRALDFAWGAQWQLANSDFFTARLPWPLRVYRWALAARLPQSSG